MWISDIINSLKLGFLILLPKNLVSRWIGRLTELILPKPVLALWIRWFIHNYKIDMSEALLNIEDFKTFNQFFTRELKPGTRPVHPDPCAVVSPVDGYIAAHGHIQDGQLIQVKGLMYSLENLVKRKNFVDTFNNGIFITFYLSPRNYHRIHSPVSGKLTDMLYLPGTLFPVNPFAVKHVKNLFGINERIISIIEFGGRKKLAMVKVGATIVGKIKVVYDSIESNRIYHMVHRSYTDLYFSRGDELGRFEMGSTVILLFERGKINLENLKEGTEICMGQMVGRYEFSYCHD